MERREYSAGAVKLSFWFMEFKKMVKLLDEGKTKEEIKELNQNENIFSAPTSLRAEQIFNTVWARTNAIDKSFYKPFLESDVATQKLFVLVATMAHDRLFFDFVYEVIREKMIIGDNQLSDSDVRVFFKNKQQQSDKVASWTDATLVRLGRCYKTMLFEAGIIDKSKDSRTIIKPILNAYLQRWLEEHNMIVYEKVLTGVR
jgi:hypothetical protein